MSQTDLLSDSLARIRNGQMAGLKSVLLHSSNAVKALLSVLHEEGYISGWSDDVKYKVRVDLKYYKNLPVIESIKRISKSSCRVYSKVSDLHKFSNALGIVIVSTSQGVLSGGRAVLKNVGGEVLCSVY